jgi:hypothetical protein
MDNKNTQKPGQDINIIIQQMLNGLNKTSKNIIYLKKKDLLSMQNPYNNLENIINNLEDITDNNYKVSGVDSGFVNKQFNFSNITIIKEVGCVFTYKNNKLESTKYYPKIYNRAKPYLTTSSLELEEIMWNTSILRLIKEVDLTTSIIEDNKDLDAALIDGSIIPQYINKPTKECPSTNKYKELLNKFINLYNKSREKKIFLVGCIEDCRANRFFNFLKDEVLDDQNINFNLFDSYLCFSLLNKNQRTCVFKYTKDYKKHPILKEFPKSIADNLYCCYLKLSNYDYPLRIEFIYFEDFGLSLLDYTKKIIQIITSISNFNKNYTYPSPLIEADLRSRLKLDEIDLITKKILEKTLKFGFRLPRRQNRIF